jgi:hypothetical protein
MNGFLKNGDVEGFLETLQALFADIAYRIHPAKGSSIANMEKYCHSMFYLALRLLGYNIQAEGLTHRGRIDAVITTKGYVYLVEFKLEDAAAALAQIKAKGHHQKYLASGKQVMLLWIGFDAETRNVGGYLVEVVG